MGFARALHYIQRIQQVWASAPPKTAWSNGLLIGLNVGARAPGEARLLIDEMNRLVAAINKTSPEPYEVEQDSFAREILGNMEVGRVPPLPPRQTDASIVRQASLIVEMANGLAEQNVAREIDPELRTTEVSRRMGVYLAGIILGMRIGRVHTDSTSESLAVAVMSSIYNDSETLVPDPEVMAHLEMLELETVRKIVTGEGFDA